MNIRKKKKVKSTDKNKALYKDCKAVEKVSIFGSFILCFVLAESLEMEVDKKVKKLYKHLLKGYVIPKNYSLIFRNKKEVVEKKGKVTVINIKKFNREVFKNYLKK